VTDYESDELVLAGSEGKVFSPGKSVRHGTSRGEASVTWRAIEYGVELLKYGAINRIGDGESTRIWWDNWIPRMPNMRPSRPVRACRLHCVFVVDEASIKRVG
jgi:hypothetical protein